MHGTSQISRCRQKLIRLSCKEEAELGETAALKISNRHRRTRWFRHSLPSGEMTARTDDDFFLFFQEKGMLRALCAFLSAAPVPIRLEGSPLRKQTGPAGGGWKLGHRPEEFRSLGRLSTSELCSLPMVPAAVAAEERRARRSPLRRRDDRAGAGDRGQGCYTECGHRCRADLWRPRARPTQVRGRRERGGPIWGTDTQGSAARWHEAGRLSSGNPKGRRWRTPSFSPASGRRAAPLSLTRSCAVSSLLPGRGLAAPATRGRQFRVGEPATPRPEGGRVG